MKASMSFIFGALGVIKMVTVKENFFSFCDNNGFDCSCYCCFHI